MFLFLHIPKTAGTTFQFILENSFGITHCHLGHVGRKVIDQRDLNLARSCFPGLQSIAGENLFDPLRLSLPAPFYMTFLREPITRVFSHYQDDFQRCGKKIGFEQMLQTDERLKNFQVKCLAGGPDLDRAKRVLEKFNFVGLSEKFDLSLHVLNRLSPTGLNLNYKRKLTAPDNSIKRSLQQDQRMVDLTREHNRLDLELYDFATKEIFPKFCLQAGCSPADQVASYEQKMTERQPMILLHRFYNRVFFRQICKVYRKRRARQEAA
jgi:hypothetical protein